MATTGIARLLARHMAWIAPLIALLVFGAWSFWVHRGEGSTTALRAGLTQGGYAVLSTVALRSVVLALYRRWRTKRHGMVVSYLLSLIVIILVPAAMHAALGNKHIWLAIAPGVGIGAFYITLTLRLERVREIDPIRN